MNCMLPVKPTILGKFHFGRFSLLVASLTIVSSLTNSALELDNLSHDWSQWAGAWEQARTADLFLTKETLYQLSYPGTVYRK